jgi:hypothetical protein
MSRKLNRVIIATPVVTSENTAKGVRIKVSTLRVEFEGKDLRGRKRWSDDQWLNRVKMLTSDADFTSDWDSEISREYI